MAQVSDTFGLGQSETRNAVVFGDPRRRLAGSPRRRRQTESPEVFVASWEKPPGNHAANRPAPEYGG